MAAMEYDDIKNFDPHSPIFTYRAFLKLKDPINDNNISNFEHFGIDTELFENDPDYQEFIANEYNTLIASWKHNHNDDVIFMHWEPIIAKSFMETGDLPLRAKNLFTLEPDTLELLAKKYFLRSVKNVSEFVTLYKNSYYSKDCLGIRKSLEYCFSRAMENNDFEFIKTFITRVDFSKILYSSSLPSLEIFEYIYNFGAFTDENLNRFFYLATLAGRIDILEFIYNTGKIKQETINEGFDTAVFKGYLDIVKFLLPKIDFNNIDNQLKLACKLGYLSILKELISKDPLSDYEKSNLIILARATGNKNIVKFLQQ